MSSTFTCTPAQLHTRRRLIITADDFGYSQERDDGIVECFQQGAVTTTSLLVNGESAEAASDVAKKHRIPVGLHLNLSEGYPVCDTNARTSLVDSKGFMLGKFGFREALKDGKIDLEDVKREIVAQVESFQTLMETEPTHVDGHQHVHVLPGIADVFAETLKECGIKLTRLPIEHSLDSCEWLSKAELELFHQFEQQSNEAKAVFQRYDIRYPDVFLGLSTMGSNMTIDHLQDALTSAKNEIGLHNSGTSPMAFELMTHPGNCSIPGRGGCGGGPDDFSLSKDREIEMSVLKSVKWKQILAMDNIDLCSYKDLM